MKLPPEYTVEACGYFARLNTLIFQLDLADDHVLDIVLALIDRDEPDEYSALFRYIITNLRRTRTTLEQQHGRKS